MTVGLARKLSRTKPHRDALLRNLVSQLLQHGSLTSTHAKCKEASRLADNVISIAKRANDPSIKPETRSKLVGNLQARLFLSGDNRHLLTRLLTEIAPLYEGRSGGFTRVMHLEKRFNDRAPQSLLELVQTPVVDPATGDINRGNLKFWLLVKNVINDELTGAETGRLTLVNLKKIANFKSPEEFKNDIAVIKRCIMDQQGDKWDEAAQNASIDKLVATVNDTVLPGTGSAARNELKRGYKFVEKRPERPTTAPAL